DVVETTHDRTFENCRSVVGEPERMSGTCRTRPRLDPARIDGVTQLARHGRAVDTEDLGYVGGAAARISGDEAEKRMLDQRESAVLRSCSGRQEAHEKHELLVYAGNAVRRRPPGLPIVLHRATINASEARHESARCPADFRPASPQPVRAPGELVRPARRS